VQCGDRAAIVFIVQRPDADRFEPNAGTDLGFALALSTASRYGVEVYAYTCRLSTKAIELYRLIDVDLRPHH
jgi:sugar fermentation stimulation protein A